MSNHTTHDGTDHAVDAASAPAGRANRVKPWVAIAVAGALVGLGVAWFVVANREDKAPYTDPAATGTLTFCDADGHEVTEGSVKDAPFADLAVGSTAAGGRYAGGKATLFAYQPRQGVLAEEFSGNPLTGSRDIADPAHPAARITDESTTLADFVAGFPAVWDGYVQLRLILTADATSPQTDRYDTADVRVDGGRWKLVTGGGGTCPVSSD